MVRVGGPTRTSLIREPQGPDHRENLVPFRFPADDRPLLDPREPVGDRANLAAHFVTSIVVVRNPELLK